MNDLEQFLNHVFQAWPWVALSDGLRYFLTVPLIVAVLCLAPRAWLKGRAVRIREVKPGQSMREFAWSLQTIAVFSLVGACVFAGQQLGILKVYESIEHNGLPYFVASILIIIVLHDAWFYWTHRLMHQRMLFRWAHLTHHQSQAPTPWAAYSFGLVDAMVQAAFLPLILLALPMHPVAIFVWMTHMILRNTIGHSGSELVPGAWLAGWWGRWLTTSLHHELHHAYGRGNYGLYFVWWDRLCKTEHPAYQEQLKQLIERICNRPAKHGTENASVKLQVVLTGIAVVLLSYVVGASTVDAADIKGEWTTQGHSARVNIQTCEGSGDRYCGVITWLWEPLDKAGEPNTDANNPEPQLRVRPLVGIALLKGFRSGKTQTSWTGGTIYNPEDGRTYKASMRLRSADILEVEGCVLMFCARQVWRRLPSQCTP